MSGSAEATVSRTGSIFSRLYRGETAFDFVGRKKWWFSISAIVIVAGLVSLATSGLNFSIDFKGGVSWQVSEKNINVATAQKAVAKAGLANATVTILGGKTLSVDAKVTGSQASRDAIETKVEDALAKLAHTQPNNVSVSFVGPSWGGNISSKAIEALVIFFLAIAAYISIRFEWRMAIAAIVAVIHDLAVTVGVYALSGFQVTPDTVIAVLTILGYSLYDTVVVFDRIEDHTKGIGATGRLTYSDTVNLSMNQVLMRSINTSLVAILPILSVLILGAYVLGAATLQNFGLALFIGLTSGAYSSIFIASPLLAILKERETRYATIRRRLESRGADKQLLSPADLARAAASGGSRISASRSRVTGQGGATVAGAGRARRTIEPGSARTTGVVEVGETLAISESPEDGLSPVRGQGSDQVSSSDRSPALGRVPQPERTLPGGRPAARPRKKKRRR